MLPFAARLEGAVYRVYFSGRDAQNRSRPGYFDADLGDPGRCLRVAEQPLLDPGPPGTFDDAGVVLSWIVADEDTRYAYYVGWNLSVAVPFRNALGLAVSRDGGRTFGKYSAGPILDRSVYDPCFVASACVLREAVGWRMWYVSCVRWELTPTQTRHLYHIKYAESQDGIHWQPTGQTCIDFKSEDEYAISRPCVLKEDGIYRMWYSYRGAAYRIGYAESGDGLHWERKDEEAGIDVSESGWDSEMIEYPFVFDHDGERYMLYNGNGYGATGIGLAVLAEA